LFVADFLSLKRDEIATRLRELAPVVDEYQRLEAAAAALASIQGPTPRTRNASGPASRARRGGGGGRARAGSGAGRRGRPRGTGTRALQTLELVRSQPGITITEIAAKMGIKQNYLYRVLPGLEKDGQVAKRDGGWHPTDNGQPAAETTPTAARTPKRRAAARPRSKAADTPAPVT